MFSFSPVLIKAALRASPQPARPVYLYVCKYTILMCAFWCFFFLFLFSCFQLFSRTQASNEILNIPLASTSSHSREIKGIVLPLLSLLFSIFFLSTRRSCCQGHLKFKLPFSREVGCCWAEFHVSFSNLEAVSQLFKDAHKCIDSSLF